MNHLENLTKLRDTLKEKLAETNDMADYEGKYGSASTSERLKDECKRLNDSIDSLEWVIKQQESMGLMLDRYTRRLETVDALLTKAEDLSQLEFERVFTQQVEYTRLLFTLNNLTNEKPL